MKLKLPKVNYEVCIYNKGEIYDCILSNTFKTLKEVDDFLQDYDLEKYDVSIQLIGGICTW